MISRANRNMENAVKGLASGFPAVNMGRQRREFYNTPRAAERRVDELKDFGYSDAVWYYSPEDPTMLIVKYTY